MKRSWGELKVMFFRVAAIFAPFFVPLFAPITTWAALGAPEASVQDEARAQRVDRVTTRRERYSIHEIAPKKFAVRQFATANGNVFAVAWQGRNHPNLRVLMGAHYREFQDALNVAKAGRHGHAPLALESGNIHLEVGGHGMVVYGRVWLINQIPQGVATHELR